LLNTICDFVLSDGTTVHLIGDPHLGRKFEVGVPSHRRGEREAKQMQHFRNELAHDSHIVVIMGDVFDHPYVSLATIEETANALLSTAEHNPDVVFIVLAGNHDLPRNLSAIGAFHDLVQRIRDRFSNLHILRSPTMIHNLALFPWEWNRRADDQAKELDLDKAEVAIGHWDLKEFDGHDDHLAPVAQLGHLPMYSGHYHVPGDYIVNGVTVHCTGSMEPYAHDQDPDNTLYLTMTLNELLSKDANEIKDKCVRVLLQPGQDLPEIDCLALTHKRVRDEDSATEVVSLDTFDWSSIVAERLKPLHPDVKAFITERLPKDGPEEQC